MASVIALASPKGGVGKTTTSIELASALHQEGRSVVIVESDARLLSIAKWAATARGAGHNVPDVALAKVESFSPRVFAKLVDSYDVAVVDCPGHFAEEQRAAMLLADAIIMPVGPSAIELAGLTPLLEVVTQAERIRRRPLPMFALLTRVRPREIDAVRVRRALEEMGVPVLDVEIGYRAAFRQAYEAGESVVCHSPRSDSAREVRRLVRELTANGILSPVMEAARALA